jgi:ClpP class serine protease
MSTLPDQVALGAIIDILWIIILVLVIFFIFIIPMMQRRTINSARRRLLSGLGQKRKSQVITLIHRQETVSLLGIPIVHYIDIDDSEEVLRAIRSTPPDVPIDLILHTPGGLALAATQIALALRAHPRQKTVIIPHYAMSGGTMIALAADRIIMDPHAALGPVDPQLLDQTGIYPAVSLLNVLEKKHINRIDDRTVMLADEAKKAIDQTDSLIRKLLADRYSPEQIDRVLIELSSGKYPHDHPLMAEDVVQLLGDSVSTTVPGEVYDLMKLYRMEVARRRPGVEYVPVAPKR